MIIYLVENRCNGKRYVGLTKHDLDTRWNQHTKDAFRGSSQPLHRAIRKYGEDEFVRAKIDMGESEEHLRILEKYWIETLGTFGSSGYNATRGGDGVLGLKHSDDTRRRMGESRKGERNHNYGKSWGRSGPFPEETKRKMSAAAMGRTHTAETRKKISESQFKKVVQCDDAGLTIKVFNSFIEAATAISSKEDLIKSMRAGISRACKFPTRRAGGYYWKYLETEKG